MTTARHLPILTLVLTAFIGMHQASAGNEILTSKGDSTPDRSLSSSSELFQLTADKDSTRAFIKVAGTRSNSGIGFTTHSIIASAPLKKTEDIETIATLDSFVNSSNFEYKFSNLVPKSIRPVVPDEAEAYYGNFLGDLQQAWREKGKEGDEPKHIDSGIVASLLPKRLKEWDAYLFDDSKDIPFYGGSIKIGYEEFDYLRENSFTENSTKRVPYGGKLFYGRKASNKNLLWTISYEVQNAFKATDKKTICLPIDGASEALDCKTESVGVPLDNDKELAALELRTLIGDIGVSSKFTYDFENDNFGIDLPIYLFKNGEGKLSGGIRIGWTDEADEVTVGYFASSVFNVFK